MKNVVKSLVVLLAVFLLTVGLIPGSAFSGVYSENNHAFAPTTLDDALTSREQEIQSLENDQVLISSMESDQMLIYTLENSVLENMTTSEQNEGPDFF